MDVNEQQVVIKKHVMKMFNQFAMLDKKALINQMLIFFLSYKLLLNQ